MLLKDIKFLNINEKFKIWMLHQGKKLKSLTQWLMEKITKKIKTIQSHNKIKQSNNDLNIFFIYCNFIINILSFYYRFAKLRFWQNK
jgi:hypothetical protein